jgi:excisionase family DNA binding protein
MSAGRTERRAGAIGSPGIRGGKEIVDLPVEPLGVSILEAARLSGGCSRSTIYRDLAAGRLRAVKIGTRTLVLLDSLRERFASLPPANFRSPNNER